MTLIDRASRRAFCLRSRRLPSAYKSLKFDYIYRTVPLALGRHNLLPPLDVLKPSMLSFSALCCRRPFAYAATRIRSVPLNRIGLVPLARPIYIWAFWSHAQRPKASTGTSALLASGFSVLEMSGKQATLGYVRDSQLTMGCVAGLHWISFQGWDGFAIWLLFGLLMRFISQEVFRLEFEP